MTLLVIACPPNGGGDHLKNILCLDDSFSNSDDLNIDAYRNPNDWNLPPKKITAEEIKTASKNWYQMHIIQGHFGELAYFRNQIIDIIDKKFIILTQNNKRDKFLLDKQSRRLKQVLPTYYREQEQFYLYQPEIYQTYFNVLPQEIYTIGIDEFWHPDVNNYNVIDRINNFLGKNIDRSRAQVLHNHWHINNNIDFY